MSRVITSDSLNVTLFETGDSITISGLKYDEVELVLRQLEQMGATVLEEPSMIGPVWTAICRRPEVANAEAQVEKLGHRFFVRGRSIESVRAEVDRLTGTGREPRRRDREDRRLLHRGVPRRREEAPRI